MNQVTPEELDAFLDAVQRKRGLSDLEDAESLPTALVKAIYKPSEEVAAVLPEQSRLLRGDEEGAARREYGSCTRRKRRF